MTFVLDFLTELYDSGLKYSSINTARSAVSQYALNNLGANPLVIRFMKGVFNLRPSVPRYTQIWDVSYLLNSLAKLSPVRFLSLKQLTIKTSVLLALVLAARGQSLTLLNLSRMTRFKDKVEFTFKANELKQARPGYKPEKVVIARYEVNRKVCPVVALLEYMKRTEGLRGDENQLFISYCKPYKKVTRDTISRWVKSAMCSAGIDTKIFKAHSVRSAATSKARLKEVPIDKILSTAGWSNAGTFAKFYDKPVIKDDKSFENAVLAQ